MKAKPTFSSTNLTNHFLVAMPGMEDPHFSKTLTFICEHSDKGAIGLVINKPTDVTLERLFGEIKINIADHSLAHETVYFGGPVLTDRGFVLHQPLGDWGSTLKVSEDIGLTTSKDILEALAKGEGPSHVLVTLGYAGWGPGQLEDEIIRNGWLTVAANTSIIFDVPYQERLTAAMSLLGVSVGNLSGAVGHA